MSFRGAGRDVVLELSAARGSVAFELRKQRLVATARYTQPHFSLGFIPDREHQRLFRIDEKSVALWTARRHRLDRHKL